MQIYAYDIETTGLSKQYDVPLQFAACIYDDDMNLLKETNLRGRLPRFVLPSPEALLVTCRSMTQIQSASLSHYEFMKMVADDICTNSPAIMVTYNGIAFDEEVLRHSFYTNLLQPYLTQQKGNLRFDVLTAARASVACDPSKLKVPRNSEGRRSMRLADLACANGFIEHVAHDALGDVLATVHIAEIMAMGAPEVWNRVLKLRNKQIVLDMMRSGEPLVMVDLGYEEDQPSFRVLVPITPDETNPNEWICLCLDSDIDGLLKMDASSLEAAFQPDHGRQPILRVKVNTMPILFTLADAATLRLPITLATRSTSGISRDVLFAARLRATATQIKSRLPEPALVQEQLYSGGFFPVETDRQLIDRFHRVSPQERWDLIPDLSDQRARELARWLVGSEWPEVLSSVDRRSIEDEFRDHLMQDEAKWTTVPSALRRINQLSADATDTDATILEDYRAHLLKLRDGREFFPSLL